MMQNFVSGMSAHEVRVAVSNRKARHDYHIFETVEAGIVLTGTEVKSLRAGTANLQDSYALVERGEVWLHGMHISPYEYGSISNHEPRRPRKLLLHRKEIRKLLARVQEKGLTLVPLAVYFKGPHAKIDLAIAQGKRKYDKRQALKEREVKRDLAQRLKRGSP